MNPNRMLTHYGCFTWYGFLLPFEEHLQHIRSAGFQRVCTWWGDDLVEVNGRKEDQAALADRYGLMIEHAHLPYYGCNSLWAPGQEGERLVASYVTLIQSAGDCKIPTLVMHPFEMLPPVDRDNAVFYRRFDRLVDACVQSDVRLAVENLSDWPTLIEILDHYRDCAATVGLCFDSGHANIVSHNDFSLIHRYRDRLMALHLHDNNGHEDQHLLPYEGNIEWGRLIAAINQTTYAGSFMLEACYPYHGTAPAVSPDAYLAGAYAACERATGSCRQ